MKVKGKFFRVKTSEARSPGDSLVQAGDWGMVGVPGGAAGDVGEERGMVMTGRGDEGRQCAGNSEMLMVGEGREKCSETECTSEGGEEKERIYW